MGTKLLRVDSSGNSDMLNGKPTGELPPSCVPIFCTSTVLLGEKNAEDCSRSSYCVYFIWQRASLSIESALVFGSRPPLGAIMSDGQSDGGRQSDGIRGRCPTPDLGSCRSRSSRRYSADRRIRLVRLCVVVA